MKMLKSLAMLAVGTMAVSVLAAEAQKPADARKCPDAKCAASKCADKSCKDDQCCGAQKPAAQQVDVWASLPETVATIGGKPVMKQEVIAEFMKQVPDGKLPAFFTPEFVQQIAPMLVEQIVQMKLMDQAMAKANFNTTPEAVRAFLNEQIKKMPQEQVKMMTQQLAMQKKTIGQYIDELVANPEVRKGITRGMFAEATFLKDVKVDEAEAKKFYDEHPQMFRNPGDPAGSIRASHILILVDQKATEAQKKAALEKINNLKAQLTKDPKQFEALAKSESQCPSGKQGGSLGAFGKGQMVPEFEAVAFALKPGEISEIVTTQFGYHIIRRDPPQGETVMPFENVKGQLIEALKGQKSQAAEQKFMDDLKKEMKVQILVKPAAKPAAAAAPAAK